MDRRQIASVLVLKSLGIPTSLKTFNKRLIVQKAIYLAQSGGINLGYHYSWYLRGPYSSSVAGDLFAALDEPAIMSEVEKKWHLSDTLQSSLKQLQENVLPVPDKFRKTISDTDTRKASWLELLASVHFLIDKKQVTKSNEKEISTVLKRYKKDYSPDEVKLALQVIKESKLLTTKEGSNHS